MSDTNWTKELSKRSIIFICLFVALAITVPVIYSIYKNNADYSTYLQQGNKCMENDDLQNAEKSFENALKSKNTSDVTDKLDLCKRLINSKEQYINALKEYNDKDYLDAYSVFNNVSKDDKRRYSDAQAKIQECSKGIVAEYLSNAKESAKNNDFDKAIVCIGTVLGYDHNNQEALKLKTQYEDLKKKQVVEEQKKAEEQTQQAQAAAQKQAAEEEAKYTPQKIVDSNGKQIWKIYINSGELHFTGTYKGTGNFIVKLSDSNQDMIELIANEIGDYVSDKTVSVPYVGWYYLEVDGSDGKWDYKWQ